MHLTSFAHNLEFLSHLTYWKMFLVLLSSGHVVPVPESVVLILLGYLSALGKVKIWAVLAVGIFTTVFVDLIMYTLSLSGSELAMKFSKGASHALRGRYERAEERHLFALVFFSHFIPGWRFMNPIIAGVTQMPWKKFTLYTLISALAYGPFYAFIGYIFHTRVAAVIAAIQSAQHLLFSTFIIGVVVFFIVYNTRSKEHHAKE
ncbi:DedA family protein [Candidatus Parcubacteria bacterium]|nr:DedA family protein [Candidatus Parcubacteria bacterium]